MNLKTITKLALALLLSQYASANIFAQSDDLGAVLKRCADDTIAYCDQHEFKSVGVLKFLVVKDDQEFSDHVGTINSLLAQRMEVALVLANNPRDPITLIEDASTTAETITGATHLTKAGRKLLLDGQYTAMWGDQKIKPDVLVTGIAQVGTDFRTLTISMLEFDQKSNELKPIGKDHVARIEPNLLSEVGESFSTRGAFDGGKIETTSNSNTETDPPSDLPPDSDLVVKAVKKVRTGTSADHPLNDPKSPVKLQVFYDGVMAPFEVKNGQAKIREPREGQRVEIIMTKDNTAARYGIVVKVNGQNTLYKQRLPDAQSAKWVLTEPGSNFVIRGYQLRDNKQLESFRVLSLAESKDKELDYGKDVGTITISVFPEGSPPALQLDEEVFENRLVEASRLPKESSSTFGALKAKLLAGANRGLIAEGNRAPSVVKAIKFNCSSEPIMVGSATYYSN